LIGDATGDFDGAYRLMTATAIYDFKHGDASDGDALTATATAT
jgi:hypothetical protein